ncbi:hypothetical protein H0H93_015016 [Arthromyces matolae]|nr:hypothetical protein H0H93_015016 [Arthromyces matolae]
MALIRPIAQLKTIYRVSISFNHWIPTLRREPVTRSERISERLESQTGGKVQGSVSARVKSSSQQNSNDLDPAVFMCLGNLLFFPPHKMVLIAATIEMPKADTTKAVQIPPFIANALRLVGTVLQIHLNWRSHSFAGRARIAAFLDMFRGLVTLTPFIPAMVGTHSNHVELLAGNIIHILFAFITLWQALALPLPQDRVEEDHGE